MALSDPPAGLVALSDPPAGLMALSDPPAGLVAPPDPRAGPGSASETMPPRALGMVCMSRLEVGGRRPKEERRS